MARLEFSSAINVKTKPERAFDYLADHRHVAQVLEGVSRWEPIGARTKGLGARYKVEMLAFGIPLKNVLRLDRWRRGREIGWISESDSSNKKAVSPSARGRTECGSSCASRTSRLPRCSGQRSRGASMASSGVAWRPPWNEYARCSSPNL